MKFRSRKWIRHGHELCREDNYRGADKSLARPTSRCILFDGENISFDARIYIYIHIHIRI